jgi:beta-galactosidase/beta-glucuronidase
MKYHQYQHYSTFQDIKINGLSERSYFIPYESEQKLDNTSLLEERYQSSLIMLLNGPWDFAFFDHPQALKEDFDTDQIPFSLLDVPSCIQFRGYDRPLYLNCRYMFPYSRKGKIPTVNKVKSIYYNYCNGKYFQRIKPSYDVYNFILLYRKKLTLLAKEDVHYIITFLGVSANFDLYVNGAFVAYFEGSHNMHEADISPFLQPGENEIVVLSHRWCNGTYLEDQDMFRNNGIFRDVYIKKEKYLFDYQITYAKYFNFYRLQVDVSLYQDALVEVDLTINGQHYIKSSSALNQRNFIFDDLKVEEWNSEKPTCYLLKIKVNNQEFVRKYIGFKHIEIKGDKFYLNDHLIKIRGVNHHDTSPKNGYYLTPSEIEQDLSLCKAYNVNTIRTSHYPSDPLLYDLSLIKGIYLIDECDLETHGTYLGVFPPSYNLISHNPKWKEHYLDRVRHLYQRDKNNTAIIMWSLGNEAGGYYNQDQMYAYLKNHSSLPIHYEGAIHSARKGYDVMSEMYPSIEHVCQVGEHRAKIKKENTHPFILCEYAHAMGVGPGCLEEYLEAFYTYDNVMGGCIWEMVDHAVLEKDGTYTYGGYHDEYIHDGNFCVDGLFYPDRTPSIGAKEMKFAYRPLLIKYLWNGDFEIFNSNNFISSRDYTIVFHLKERDFSINLEIEPLKKGLYHLEQDISNLPYLNISIYDQNHYLVSEESVILNYHGVNDVSFTTKAKLVNQELVFDQGKVYLENDLLTYQFQNEKLTLNKYGTILFRAPTDNDVSVTNVSELRNYLHQENILQEAKFEEGKITLIYRIKSGKRKLLNKEIIEVDSHGLMKITSSLIPLTKKGNLFRFGKDFRLNLDFNQIEYLGRSEESYRDIKNYTPIKQNIYSLDDFSPHYIRPQESESRCDVQYLKISSSKVRFIFQSIDEVMEMGIKTFDDDDLLKMKHTSDLKKDGVFITLSKFNQGIGTGSCGPITLEKYRFPCNQEYVFKLLIKGESCDD